MTDSIDKKVETALKLIRAFSLNNKRLVEISYSGGKDSDVILELAKMAGIKYRAIYKNTTIDPPGTIQHCLDNGVEILQPKVSFLKLIEHHGLPTRRVRFCCDKLKEYKVLDFSIQGIRRTESIARNKRYDENDPIICRNYGSKKKHCNVCLPILSWTDKDIAKFIEERNIKCHPLYYDKHGKFHSERRLGCIGCPMKSDAGKADYRAYPKLFRQVVKAVCVWWNNHPNAASINNFDSPYGLLAHNLFFKSYQDWQRADFGLFGKTDWLTYLQQYFNVDLDYV